MLLIAALSALAGLLALSAFWAVRTRQRFVLLRSQIAEALAQMEALLSQSYEEISRITGAASGCLTREHPSVAAVEQARLRAMTAARSVASAPTTRAAVQALSETESELRAAVERLATEVEQFADMGNRRVIERLLDGLSAARDDVSAMRQKYNDRVLTYNTRREHFPASWVASACHFEAAQPFNPKAAVRAPASPRHHRA